MEEKQQQLQLIKELQSSPKGMPQKRLRSDKPSISSNWKKNPDYKPKQRPTATASATASASYIGIDCEMISTEEGPNTVARVSLVDLDGNTLLDEYVKPSSRVKNLRTPITGIRNKHLQHASSFPEVQGKVLALISGNLLIGHAVHNDLRCLRLQLPAGQVLDTQKLYSASCKSKKKKISLQELYFETFHKAIQLQQHSSVEDARCTVEVFKTRFLDKVNPLGK